MNYWPRYVGDIQRKTGHLSCAEMGAYDRLLDHVYATEQPLPGDIDACCRIARAMDKAERKAVESVLRQFFTLDGEHYINARAAEEIAKATPRLQAAKANGSKGGRRKATQKEPSGLPAGLPVASDWASSPTPTPTPEAKAKAFARSPAAEVCLALKDAGIGRVNPSNVRLAALLEAGASVGEFVSFAGKALEQAPGRAFEYVIGAVEGERKRAAVTTLHKGPMPNKQQALEARNQSVGEAWAAKMREQLNAG